MCVLSRRLEIDHRAHVNTISGRIRAESGGIFSKGRRLRTHAMPILSREQVLLLSCPRQRHGFHLGRRRSVDAAIDRIHATKSVIRSDSLLFNFFFRHHRVLLWLCCVCLFFCYQYFSALLLNWLLVKRKRRTGKNTKVQCYKMSFSHFLLLWTAAEKCHAKTIFFVFARGGKSISGRREETHVLKMNTTSTFLFLFLKCFVQKILFGRVF